MFLCHIFEWLISPFVDASTGHHDLSFKFGIRENFSLNSLSTLNGLSYKTFKSLTVMMKSNGNSLTALSPGS